MVRLSLFGDAFDGPLKRPSGPVLGYVEHLLACWSSRRVDTSRAVTTPAVEPHGTFRNARFTRSTPGSWPSCWLRTFCRRSGCRMSGPAGCAGR